MKSLEEIKKILKHHWYVTYGEGQSEVDDKEFEVLLSALTLANPPPPPNTDITYNDIIKAFDAFAKEFTAHWEVDDVRPNGYNSIYVWLKNSKFNLIITYFPETKQIRLETTNEFWNF